jgi:hypothetical protein
LESINSLPSSGNYSFHLQYISANIQSLKGYDIRQTKDAQVAQKMKQVFNNMQAKITRAHAIQAEQADIYQHEGQVLKTGDFV